MEGVRYLVLFLVSLAIAVDYFTRSNINVAIVSMALPLNATHEVSDVCPIPTSTANATDVKPTSSAPRYDWSMTAQGSILSSFGYSYLVMQIPAAKVSQAFGGKWVICAGLLGSGVINILTPFIASSQLILMASRLALGFFQGGILAAGYGILFSWFPIRQRSTAYAMMYFAGAIGTSSTSFLSGYLCDHGFAGGWPSVFYISGVLGLFSFVISVPLLSSKPSEHQWITQEELDIINEDKGGDVDGTDVSAKQPIPWLAILSSMAFWSVTYQCFAKNFAYSVAASELPTYLNQILHVNSTENGFLNSLIYISNFTSTPFFGPLSEYVISKNWISRTNVRKLFTSTMSTIMVTCFLTMPYFNCNMTAMIVLFVLAVWSMGMDSGGCTPTIGEMSNNFPSVVFAMYNTVVSATDFLAPMATAYLLTNGEHALYQWNLLFYLTAAVSLSGMLISLVFLKAERQSWDYVDSDNVGLL
ncbi:putative inorganic phosphate cotransporter [Halotydeus destructor]|nr:putative inorganic phosphate cotransporter [Halotydeus destructor]